MRAFVNPGYANPNLACLPGNPIIVPYEAIGKNLRNALNASEASENAPGVFAALFRANRDGKPPSPAMLLSRRVYCVPGKLKREINELRTAIQLDRQYSKPDLFAMMANTAYFGTGIVGVESASEHFFHKRSKELNISEAALIGGMVSSPGLYSPERHAERALERRNQVIDAMARNGLITAEEAEIAKTASI